VTRAENILEESARRWGGHAAIVDTSGSYSYDNILASAKKIESFLRSEGIEPGSVIGFSAIDARCFLPMLFGIVSADCVALPIASHLPTEEALHYATTADISATLRAVTEPTPLSPHVALPGSFKASLTKRVATKRDYVRSKFPDAAIIRFSSGTTATPKGVVLSHTSVIERATISERSMEISSVDRVLSTLSLSYHFIASAISFIRAGATILDGSRLSDEALVYFAQNHFPTMIYAAPSHYQNLCERAQPEVLTRLRRAISASAPLPGEIARLFESRFNLRLIQAYGIIEVGLPIWNDSAECGPEELGWRKEPYECEVLDSAGYPVAYGEIGELAIRGPGLFSGYIFAEGESAAHCPAQWFLTGDLVVRSRSGLFSFKGRASSRISIGERVVYPEQIETVLKRVPEVLQARVRAETHPAYGKRLIAEIVPCGDSPGALQPWKSICERELPAHLQPDEFRIVAAIPSTGSGKVIRFANA